MRAPRGGGTVAPASTIHLTKTTSATPAQFVAALTDFGPGRKQLLPNSSDKDLEVHRLGATDADVTEGNGWIWERLTYDWSNPNRIVLTTTDSNTWGGASGHTYTLTERPDGGADLDVVVVRDGKNLKGRAVGVILGCVGKGQLGKAFDTTIAAIEARQPSAG